MHCDYVCFLKKKDTFEKITSITFFQKNINHGIKNQRKNS